MRHGTTPPSCAESFRWNEFVSRLARLDGARRGEQLLQPRGPGFVSALGDLELQLHIIRGILAPAGADQVDQFLEPLLVPLDALRQVGDDDEAVVLEADGACVLGLSGARLMRTGAVAVVERGIELVVEAVGLLVDLLDLRLEACQRGGGKDRKVAHAHGVDAVKAGKGAGKLRHG